MKKNKGRTTRFKGVHALGNGTYRLRIYMTDPATGRQVEKVKTVTAASASEAFRLKQELEVSLGQEERQDQKQSWDERADRAASADFIRFGDAIDKWWSEISTRKLEEDPAQMYLCPSTYERYAASIRDFLKPAKFVERNALQLTAEDVREWRNSIREAGYAPSTVNAHHRVLKSVLRSLGNEAASEVKELNETVGALTTRKQPNRLNADELDRFLEVAKARWPQHYALILVLCTTTMRLSTALALRWEDLDLETKEIVVQRRRSGYGKNAKVIPGVKRNRFGQDLPPLLPEVYRAMLELRATYNEEQEASALIFPAEDGRHHYRTLLAKPFEDILEHAGITKRFTPHGCRRTGAKLYGKTAGTRMAMEIAGHLTERMHDHYAGGAEPEQKLAAARAVFGQLRAIDDGGSGSEDGGSGSEDGGSRSDGSRSEGGGSRVESGSGVEGDRSGSGGSRSKRRRSRVETGTQTGTRDHAKELT